VGGDVIAEGDEPGLRSPLCDAVMLAAGGRLSTSGQPVLLGVFGIGCDAELTPDEVLGRLSLVAEAGGLCGARGLTGAVADRMEAAMELVATLEVDISTPPAGWPRRSVPPPAWKRPTTPSTRSA